MVFCQFISRRKNSSNQTITGLKRHSGGRLPLPSLTLEVIVLCPLGLDEGTCTKASPINSVKCGRETTAEALWWTQDEGRQILKHTFCITVLQTKGGLVVDTSRYHIQSMGRGLFKLDDTFISNATHRGYFYIHLYNTWTHAHTRARKFNGVTWQPCSSLLTQRRGFVAHLSNRVE